MIEYVWEAIANCDAELVAHCIFKRSHVDISYDVFLSLTVVLILANSAYPEEMPHFAAFHQGLQCLPKNKFGGFLYTKG